MGISFIGLAFGILAVIAIAVLIYFCCRKKKQNSASPSQPTPAPVYPPGGGFQPAPPASGPVGWNVTQPPGAWNSAGAPYPTNPMPGGAPYPTDPMGPGAPAGSAWGQAAPAPYPTGAPGAPPPSYPSAPPPYPG